MRCARCALGLSAKNPCIPGEFITRKGLRRNLVAPPDFIDEQLVCDVLFVGIAPGKLEDEQGRVFVGPAGHLLRQGFDNFNLGRIAILNLVRCRPIADAGDRKENRNPTPEEMEACDHFLQKDLARIKARIIVPLGKMAVERLLGLEGILKWAGKLIEKDGQKYMPMLHPSYILHNPTALPKFEADFEVLGMILGRGKNEDDTKVTYRIAQTVEEAWKIIDDYTTVSGTPVVFDYETTGLSPWEGEPDILCVAFCKEEGVAHCIPVEVLPVRRFKEWLVSSTPKIAHSMKFEGLWSLVLYGVFPEKLYYDTLIAARLLDENSPHNLSYLAYRYTPIGGYDVGIENHKAKGLTHAEMPREEVCYYCCGDVDATFRIAQVLRKELDDAPRLDTLQSFLVETSRVFVEMEVSGTAANVPALRKSRGRLLRRLEEVDIEAMKDPDVYKLSQELSDKNMKLNLNSHKQVSRLLFDLKGVPVIKKSKKTGKPSAGKEVIKLYEDEHPIITQIIEHRSIKSLIGNFLAKLPRFVLKTRGLAKTASGLIHPLFGPGVEVTGRANCVNPPLHGLTEKGGVKRGFVSRFEDGGILTADYSQLEYALLGCESGDEMILETFRSGKDIHQVTADLCSMERHPAKTLNYQFIYGGGLPRLARSMGVSQEKAMARMCLMESKMPRAFRWKKEVLKELHETGQVETATGWVRRLPHHLSRNPGLREHAERQAVNVKIQNPGAFIMFWTLIELQKYIKREGLRSVLFGTAHDSLWVDYFDMREAEMIRDEVMRIVARCDQNPMFSFLACPLRMDVKIGPTLGQQELFQDGKK